MEHMTDARFIAGYLLPHAAKADEEGAHVRALVIREAIRRIEDAAWRHPRLSKVSPHDPR